jgi:hypothetical protein
LVSADVIGRAKGAALQDAAPVASLPITTEALVADAAKLEEKAGGAAVSAV